MQTSDCCSVEDVPSKTATNIITVLSDGEWPVWDAFVKSHPLGTIYHTSQWQRLVSRFYGYQHLYLCLKKEGDDTIHGGLPLFVVKHRGFGSHLSSLPCAQYCNPLVSDEDEYRMLVSHVLRLVEKEKYNFCELRLDDSFIVDDIGPWPVVDDYSTYVLDITRPGDELMRSFHKSCIQRPLTKIGQHHLALRIGETEEDVRIFYGLYLGMRKRQGLLPQPYGFFRSMWEELRKDNCIEILHAVHDGTCISSVMLLWFKDTVIYEYGASSYDHLSYNPSHFLLWHAVNRGKEAGYKVLDLGRTSADNKGLSDFKSRWGTRKVRLRYCYIPSARGTALIRKNEVAVKAMNTVVRRLPSSMCRLLGRVVYSHVI